MTSKKHKPWHKALAAKWKAQPIEYCEVRFNECVGRYGLAPAHSLDRRDIHTKEQFFEVVAACEKCHWKLDREMPKDERLRIVRETIQKREI